MKLHLDHTMKKLTLFILLSLGLTSISLAGYLDDWTDDQLCGWMDNSSPPEYIVVEINKRGLSCGGGNKASASKDTPTAISNTDTSDIGGFLWILSSQVMTSNLASQ